jgi:hypothetical protein
MVLTGPSVYRWQCLRSSLYNLPLPDERMAVEAGRQARLDGSGLVALATTTPEENLIVQGCPTLVGCGKVRR